MRDTLVFRATAAVLAGVMRDMPCTDHIGRITKNDRRVAQLKVALQKFVFPKRVKLDDFTYDLTIPKEPFPSEQLSELLENVTVYDVTLDIYVQHVADEIISILNNEDKIYMNYADRGSVIKSTQFLTFKVIAALRTKLKPVDLGRIELDIPVTPTPEQLVVVVDDMSYSGQQLYEDNNKYLRTRITFLLVGCTEQAYKLLTLTGQKNWNVLRYLPDFIPVAEIPDNVRKYVDKTNTDDSSDDSSAGALGFVPWKIPDFLSTFDKFWKGYVYIGHAIEDDDIEQDELDLLWIPIDWSMNTTYEFDDEKVDEESIFDNSHRAPFYKHPYNALSCHHAQTIVRSRRLEEKVAESDAPLSIDTQYEWSLPKRPRVDK